jgi:hypothetical protein
LTIARLKPGTSKVFITLLTRASRPGGRSGLAGAFWARAWPGPLNSNSSKTATNRTNPFPQMDLSLKNDPFFSSILMAFSFPKFIIFILSLPLKSYKDFLKIRLEAEVFRLGALSIVKFSFLIISQFDSQMKGILLLLKTRAFIERPSTNYPHRFWFSGVPARLKNQTKDITIFLRPLFNSVRPSLSAEKKQNYPKSWMQNFGFFGHRFPFGHPIYSYSKKFLACQFSPFQGKKLASGLDRGLPVSLPFILTRLAHFLLLNKLRRQYKAADK